MPLNEFFSREKAGQYLEQMWLIRAFEEKAEDLYSQGKIHGTMHLSIGMEASAVGSVAALDPHDLILSTHRGHGHCIAKGADIQLMMAEFMGKEAGYCRGRGGSMHIADVEGGNLGANGVVAGGLPMAVGVGLGIKMRKTGQVHLCFFGDGAANNGAFSEALNMAAIYRLPIVFVCENNQYAMSLSARRAFLIEHIAERASGFGMPGEAVDGNDLPAVYRAVHKAARYARQGNGPSLIENITYRWRGHSKSDANRYRTKEEIETWKQKCPIQRFSQCLLEEGWFTPVDMDAIRIRAYQTIEEASRFAESCPEPDPASLVEGVYA